MRVQSENESEGRDGCRGWFHFDQPVDLVRPNKPADKPIPVDAEPIAKSCYQDPRSATCRELLAEELGVSFDALTRLRVGIGADEHDGTSWFSFPSRDGNGKVIGITRRYSDGSKKTFKSTTNGVFYAHEWYRHGGAVLIVEGASDTAACETLGISAIGRSSNVGGVHHIRQLLDKHASGRPVVVIGERDEKPHKRGSQPYCPADCSGCPYCFPGYYGAKHVAGQLNSGYCMPPKPYKDFRELSQNVQIWPDLLRCIH
jgi:hypothetical protein